MSTGIRVNELRLAGPDGSGRTYGASFRHPETGTYRPLSVIAGPASTGKTTIIDFIKYCLGDNDHPQHPEVIANVRSALIEVELDGTPNVIERATGGSPSKFASIWRTTFADLTYKGELRLPVEPPSDPDGLSQYLLAACDLNGVELPEAPTREDSNTHLLSMRDMFRIMFVPNERLDNRNLVFEQSNFMVTQKFLQSIDVMFGVQDNEGAILGQRLAAAQQAARAAGQTVELLTRHAEADYPQGVLQLQSDLAEADEQIKSLQQQRSTLDQQQRAAQTATTELRATLDTAQTAATKAQVRVRDRASLLDRLHALRAQYADDKRKLTFLSDAERLFDPLQITVCPACLHPLTDTPHIADDNCSLCHHPYTPAEDDTPGTAVLNAELRALTRRLDSLNEYVERLEKHSLVLRDNRDHANNVAQQAAQAIDLVTEAPAPWLAVRDNMSTQLTNARLAKQAATAGLAVWQRVTDAQDEHGRRVAEVQRITEQRKTQRAVSTRAGVVTRLSQRFAKILTDFDYPKLESPYLNERLVPHVRNLPYSDASSGGMVLIGLAWNLALWEVAHEEGADAPGLLTIDSPQKNLGHGTTDDEDFADSALVENFYRHAKQWLETDGEGAQLIVIDNSPPDLVADDIVIRFTRDAHADPYGLITDATS